METVLRMADLFTAREWCRAAGVYLFEYPDVYAPQGTFVMIDPATGRRSARVVTFLDASGSFSITQMLSEMLAEIRGTEAEA